MLSFIVPLVVIRCTICCHSLYYSSVSLKMIKTTGCHVFALPSVLFLWLQSCLTPCLTFINTVLIMSLKSRSLGVTAAVLGHLVYQKIWNPEVDDILCCLHESGSEFDMFSVKICIIKERKTIGCILRKISRPTQFLLN